MNLFLSKRNILLSIIFLSIDLYSHEIVASKIQIEEFNNTNYKISWIRPKSDNFQDITLLVNEDCNSIRNYRYQITMDDHISSWEISCNEESLNFVEASGITSNLEIFVSTIEDEEVLVGTLNVKNNIIYLDQKNTSSNFFSLGLSHMFSGLDHLLVVLLFTLLASNLMSLIKTITAFTLGHSLTLALAYLGFFTVNQSPIEALIALTIIVLALKLLISKEQLNNSIYIAGFFGLIHGFGFYGVLNEISVDQNIITNLFLFNLGIEAAQLIFIGMLLIVIMLIKYFFNFDIYKNPNLFAYGTGGIGMFWFIDRIIVIMPT